MSTKTVSSAPTKRQAKSTSLADATPAERRRALVRGFFVFLGFLYLAALAMISWETADGAEHTWYAALNLYLPQLCWIVPAIILLPIFAWIGRKWLWMPLVAIVWVAWPMMGLYWNSPDPAPANAKLQLKVMTYNIDGQPDHPAVTAEIEKAKPDIVFLQEALYVPSMFKKGWHVAGPFGGSMIASRSPLKEIEDRQLRNAPDWRRYVRCKTEVHGVPITLYGLHLDTPREALQALREYKLDGISNFEGDAMTRVYRAQAVAEALRKEKGPVIVAGDFNAPQPSMICKSLERAGLRDAFAEAGRGYGYTYGHATKLKTSYVRIDHIMVGNGWGVASCEAGSDEGSDHRPVTADLYLSQ